ncbi:FAD-dependent oxidoreductase [Microbispora sp. ATCC PTA-5024]|uniref:FAD-dependent oxidoreductase n=1 Tax=Microbispora sp. ATCC PTA-5024 TaxID=316330 RepID=UPI0003DBBB8F|nr:FAD-dependent oxidoreductase [Microbispora sp. ATCC PTA-5024]ETK36981.1 fumarate reductase [Microbispora sp. ATCC PTA-5024]
MAPRRFDHECDVLVVGFGCAGAAAAYEAAASGARVIVLERADAPGGTSALSGGEIYLGGGTSVQKACGFDDTPDDMFAYLRAALGPHADEEKLRLYCDGSLEHFRWLTDRGVTFTERLYGEPCWMPPTDDGLMWLGENAWPYRTLARPAPRGHRPPAPGFAGRLLMDALVAAATSAGATCHTGTKAVNLVLDGGGRVTGVLATRYGERVAYRARRGVVLATGGFADSDEMLEQHAPALLGHARLTSGGDDGGGIRMAAALGAATRRMSSVEVALAVVPGVVVRGMLVNAAGQRFLNEDVYPGLLSAAAVLRQPAPLWAIVDEEGYEAVPEPERWGVRPRHVAGTVAELESALGMPAGALAATVELYNRHAARGEDPLFHKDARWLRPLAPPFAALDPRDGFWSAGRGTGVSGFTLGGLRTTPDGAVLRHSGRPIGGLYAAGRTAAGLHGEGYVSGTSLGDGTFFGRRAGRAAAVEGR